MDPSPFSRTEQAAATFLHAELGDRAPLQVALEREFDESPLDDEGPVAAYSFSLADANCSHPADPRHYVFVGRTKANYYPAYGLSADDAYSLHIGTRFALEIPVHKLDDSFEPPGARDATLRLLSGYAPGHRPESLAVAGVFGCDESYFVVYRVDVGSREVYCMGGDCSPGFYELTQHPPQVALRLHLGKLIRAEAASESQEIS